MEALHLEH
jgi:hypothetical protein